MSDKKVFVADADHMVSDMFKRAEGYTLCNTKYEADIICFTGGADVNPELYGQRKMPRTHINLARDEKEVAIYTDYLPKKKFFVGICRGGQLLNVLNKGKMWQHVENHGRSHTLVDLFSGTNFTVTSTHHQMMRAHEDGHVIAVAKLGGYKEDEFQRGLDLEKYDTEVVWYPKTRSLCFQPHPEYDNGLTNTRAYFFDLLDKFY